MNDDERPWHQLVLIWIRDPARFQDYLAQMRPIVESYGGAADRSFTPISIHADGVELPDIVNLVHYDSRSAYAAFNDDPAFQRIKHLRDESVELLSFDGRLMREAPVPVRAERVYTIELVRYRNSSPDAYRRYEAEGEAAMVRYGFHVEYVLEIEPTPSGTTRFNLAKISHFPTPTDQAAFEQDPVHEHIENDLHTAAVDDTIRITATLHR